MCDFTEMSKTRLMETMLEKQNVPNQELEVQAYHSILFIARVAYFSCKMLINDVKSNVRIPILVLQIPIS